MARHKMGAKRRKSHSPKRSHRRRRIGASGKLEPIIMNGVAASAGLVAVRELSILAGHFFPQLQATPVITGVVQIGIGVLTAAKAKNGFIQYMGYGAMANGVMTVLNGAGIIGSAPATMSYQFANRKVLGDPRLQFVAGPTTRIGGFPNNFAAVAGPQRKRRYTS